MLEFEAKVLLSSKKNEKDFLNVFNNCSIEDVKVKKENDNINLNFKVKGFNWYYVSDIIKKEIVKLFPDEKIISIVRIDKNF